MALTLVAPSASASAAQVDDRAAMALARPQELIVDKSLPERTVSAMLKPVDAFYGFWNNGRHLEDNLTFMRQAGLLPSRLEVRGDVGRERIASEVQRGVNLTIQTRTSP